jgi:phosphate-selective porin
MKIALAAFVLGAAASPALAAPQSDAERLKKLEEQVKSQQSELEAMKKGAPAAAPAQDSAGSPVDVFWKDGLRFISRDKNIEAHVGGRIVLHGRTVFDRPDDTTAPLRSVPDSVFFREAYLEADAKIYKEFGVKVQADFRTGTINQTTGAAPSSVQGNLKDGYISWKRWDEFNLRLGQFYEPISYEDQTSFRFIDFAERSVMNRLLTGREAGIEFRGSIDKGLLSYRLMLANGAALLNDQGRGVVDREDEKQVAGRLMIRPLRPVGEPLLAGLELGIGGSIEDVDSLPVTGFDLSTTELSVLYLDSTGAGTFDGLRTRIMPQISWELGPVLLRGEYLIRKDEFDDTTPAFVDSALESSGWYAYATWLVTGETKKAETRVTPTGEWGAVELGLRFARIEIDNAFDNGLAAAVGNSEKVTSVTVGVNWWVRSNIRVTLNAVREDYDDKLQFDTREEDTLWGLIARAQIDF